MSNPRPWRIELEGYNYGHPYERASYAIKSTARLKLKEFRLSNPKVRYRLIEVVEDFA